MSYSIIVPIYKDEKYIKDKVDNILSFVYDPMNVEVILVIGGSENEDLSVMSRTPLVRVIRTKISGKINQLNKAFKIALGDIYVISDVDATVSSNCLDRLDVIFNKREVWCVGALTYVKGCIIDRIYWRIANQIRIIESLFYTSSHVVAPFYAFRKQLLKNNSIPDDVIADDFFIATESNIQGYRTIIDKKIVAIEHRSPLTLKDFIKHKSRKGNAILKELLRALYKFNYMPNKYKIVYVARLLQFTILTPTILFSYPFIKQGSCYEKVSSFSIKEIRKEALKSPTLNKYLKLCIAGEEQ